MTEFEREKLFEQLANAYVRIDGAALLAEDKVAGTHPGRETGNVPADTPQLDATIHRAIRMRKFARWLPGASAIAAGLLLVFFIGRSMPMPGEGAGLSPDFAPHESAVLIPLDFSMPDHLAIASVQEDRGQTVYHLQEARGDDVVLTLEYADTAGDFSALRRVTLGGEVVYAASGCGYQLLTFERGGVRYALTCRYEMDTIAVLAELILL